MAGYASTHNPGFVSKDGRTTFIVAYPPPDPKQAFNDNPEAAKKATAALSGMTVAGAPAHPPSPPPPPNRAFNDHPEAAKKATAALSGMTVAGAPVHVTGFDALSVQS